MWHLVCRWWNLPFVPSCPLVQHCCVFCSCWHDLLPVLCMSWIPIVGLCKCLEFWYFVRDCTWVYQQQRSVFYYMYYTLCMIILVVLIRDVSILPRVPKWFCSIWCLPYRRYFQACFHPGWRISISDHIKLLIQPTDFWICVFRCIFHDDLVAPKFGCHFMCLLVQIMP